MDPLADGSSEIKPKKSRAAHILVIAWFVISGLMIAFLPLGEWMKQLSIWINSLGWIAPFAYIVTYVLFCVFLIPSPALSLGVAPMFGFVKGLLLTVIAANIGASVAFVLGRTLLRKRVERWARDKPKFLAVDNAVAANGFKVVALLRMSPIFPFTIFNYLLALMRVSYWQFALGTFLGMLPLNAAFIYIGCEAVAVVGEATSERINTMRLTLKIIGIVMALVAMTVVSRISLRALRER